MWDLRRNKVKKLQTWLCFWAYAWQNKMTQTCKGDCTKEIQQDVKWLRVILWTEDRGGAVSWHPDHLNHEKVLTVYQKFSSEANHFVTFALSTPKSILLLFTALSNESCTFERSHQRPISVQNRILRSNQRLANCLITVNIHCLISYPSVSCHGY